MNELTEAVNLALDNAKGSMTEQQLADQLGCSRNTLYRWRKGDFSKAFRTIIPLTVMVNTPLPAGWAEQSSDVRILAPLLKLPDIAS